MIKKISGAFGRVVFEDQGGTPGAPKRYYRRIAAALGWPRPPEPGALVVLGEALTRNEELRAHELHVLEFIREPALAELHRLCRELRFRAGADNWAADLSNYQELRLWDRLNGQLEAYGRPDVPPGQRRIYLQAAALSEETVLAGHLAQMLEDLIRTGRKILYVGEHQVLLDLLEALIPEDMQKPAARFPWLAALGQAAADLVMWQPPEIGEPRWQHKTMKDWPGPFRGRGKGARG